MILRVSEARETQAGPDLQQLVALAVERLAAGDRAEAVAVSRAAVAQFPRTAESHRSLSNSLSYGDLYRYDINLCIDLVSEGAIAEALEHARAATRLPDASFEDNLQAGYCLTALGRFEEAADQIRRATDAYCIESNPGLFAGMDGDWRALPPKFLIIGVKKGGTTSLHHYLSRHPRVLLPIMKEVNFFASPQRGLDWYLAHFPRRPSWENRFMAGESRVDNFAERGVPENVKSYLPEARLIAVLRDPVERAISHYYHDRKLGAEPRSLDAAVEEELALLDCPPDQFESNLKGYLRHQRRYLYFGLYARHVAKWLSVFPAEQFLTVISEELTANPARELKRVFKHIGLKYQALGNYTNALPGTYDEQSKDDVRSKLAAFYARHNDQLFDMLGRRLDWQGPAGS